MKRITLDPGAYIIQWSNIGGDGSFLVRLDYIELVDTETPSRSTSWGRIRSLFR